MKSPYDKAIRHANECARRGLGVDSCAYKASNWRAAWLKAFQKAQQQELNLKAVPKGEENDN